jgi:phosphoenolpyruvate carboxykinase (GTP)
MWPGFGDNLRVLDWIIDRCEGRKDAVETPIGAVPKVEDIDTTDLAIDTETLEGLLHVDKEVWNQEVAEIEKHYETFGDKLPEELRTQLENLKAALK